MRIGIREQLALLVLLSSLICLTVISVATWINNYNFVVDIKSQGLSLTASLKAAQVNADIELLQSTCATIVTRVLIQSALQRFYTGNDTDANWSRAITDVESALASGGYADLLQAVIYPRNNTGDTHGLLNVTGNFTGSSRIQLPYKYDNGSNVYLGDPGLGYPPQLYPNITYETTSSPDDIDPAVPGTNAYAFGDLLLNLTSKLLLGPMQINSSFAIVSITLPIINNTSHVDILGYMTVIADASSLYSVLTSGEGLQNTGVVLLLGPDNMENRFSANERPVTPTSPASPAISSAKVDFIFVPTPIPGQTNRHSRYSTSGFPLSQYPAALKALTLVNIAINNATSDLSTINEQGASVAVGVARPRTNLVDWLVIVEQTHDEAFAPVVRLRNILLACVFGTFGLIALLVIPTAHFSVLPIRRLRDATEKSVQPPGYTSSNSVISLDLEEHEVVGPGAPDEEEAHSPSTHKSGKNKGMLYRLKDFRRGSRRKSKTERNEDARRRVFKIPGKVRDRKHLITDELTELTTTFNEMSDELMLQYSRLEERVEERTRELEISKKAAEAANESKTLFIANISHELKTPLNGILGMCAVCMGEDDLPRIKKSLQVVYKSGDLLLHLLNDLLTFTKNQIGQSLSLEEKEFGLSDIKSQIVTIFDKQVREGHINFGVYFLNSDNLDFSPDRNPERPVDRAPAFGPQGTGRLKDMRLWGDQHRILQVIINLVSNSLKFTPEGGRVEVRIKCLGEADMWSDETGSRKDSFSKVNSARNSGSRNSRNRHRVGSGSNASVASRALSSAQGPKLGTALLINPMDPKTAQTIHISERASTPPPANARSLMFEFVVDDTGPGIPEHLQQRVFEPFEQGDLGLSRKYGGTGLGLSICSQLATLMHGTIELESTQGVGSTFCMRIPLKFVKERASSTTSSSIQGSRPQSIAGAEDLRVGKLPGDGLNNGNSTSIGFEKDPQPRLVGLSAPFFASTPSKSTTSTTDHMDALDRVAAARSGSMGKVRVLVAEDNLVNQEVVLRMLKLEDIYDVTVAKDGQEAYDMVKASMDEGSVFNLIFMDIQMPNLDGLQSTRLIREMGYSAPIVALTAFAEESNVQECMDSGMDMFLSKPIRRPALKQVLQKFATIPEEAEEASLTCKNTSENIASTKSSTEITGSASAPITTNGDTPHFIPNTG